MICALIVYPQCTQFGTIINNIFTLSIEKKKSYVTQSQTINWKKRKKEKKGTYNIILSTHYCLIHELMLEVCDKVQNFKQITTKFWVTNYYVCMYVHT